MSSIRQALSEAHLLLGEWLDSPDTISQLEEVAHRISDCFTKGYKVLACGNGGSMADAMHFAEEFSGRFRADRPARPALALSDPTHLTCVGNDYGFERIFARGIEAFGKPGDILVVLSTSGNSANLIQAAEQARMQEVVVIGFLGRGGGSLRSLCDLSILAPGTTSDRIQELHMLALHAVIEAVEKEIGDA